MSNVVKKNKDGYGYKYTDLAEIHNYLEENDMRYYQTIETNETNGFDYIMTYRYINGEWEEKPKRGCKVVDATLSGIKNPAQEQGSALTYARRYSLLMAFGLATEDDDGASLTGKEKNKQKTNTDNYKEKVTETQAKAIYAVMTKKGLDVVANLKKNYNIENTKDLTKGQYVSILNAMKKLPDKEENKE